MSEKSTSVQSNKELYKMFVPFLVNVVNNTWDIEKRLTH